MSSTGNKKAVVVLGSVALVLVLSLSGTVAYLAMNKPRMAWVEIGKVYNEFDMKKELESKYGNVQSARKTILDSIEIQLSGMARRIELMGSKMTEEREREMREFEVLRQDYLMKKNAFMENNEQTAKNYDEQIWKQLNQYVKDFGMENGYDYLLGADGTGAVMFAKEGNEITDQVKEYVNNRYKGMK